MVDLKEGCQHISRLQIIQKAEETGIKIEDLDRKLLQLSSGELSDIDVAKIYLLAAQLLDEQLKPYAITGVYLELSRYRKIIVTVDINKDSDF